MYEPNPFPSSLSVTTYDGEKSLNSSNDFLSLYEAADYLRMNYDDLRELVENGQLDGTFKSYKTINGTDYIFSSEKLVKWMKNQF